MSTVTHVFASGGDWEGLYLDDNLKFEGHSIKAWELGDLISRYLITDYTSFTVNNEWMEEQGYLPENIKDIPDEVRQ